MNTPPLFQSDLFIWNADKKSAFTTLMTLYEATKKETMSNGISKPRIILDYEGNLSIKSVETGGIAYFKKKETDKDHFIYEWTYGPVDMAGWSIEILSTQKSIGEVEEENESKSIIEEIVQIKLTGSPEKYVDWRKKAPQSGVNREY